MRDQYLFKELRFTSTLTFSKHQFIKTGFGFSSVILKGSFVLTKEPKSFLYSHKPCLVFTDCEPKTVFKTQTLLENISKLKILENVAGMEFHVS